MFCNIFPLNSLSGRFFWGCRMLSAGRVGLGPGRKPPVQGGGWCPAAPCLRQGKTNSAVSLWKTLPSNEWTLGLQLQNKKEFFTESKPPPPLDPCDSGDSPRPARVQRSAALLCTFLNLLCSVLQVWSVVHVREGGRAWLVLRMFPFVGLRRDGEKKNLSFIALCLSCKLAHSNGCILHVVRQNDSILNTGNMEIPGARHGKSRLQTCTRGNTLQALSWTSVRS